MDLEYDPAQPCPIDVLQGLVAFEEIPNVARYLRVGRRFAYVGNETLQWAWEEGWYTYNASEHRPAQWTLCMDIEAELALRNLARPEHVFPLWFTRRLRDRSYRNARQPHVVLWVKRNVEDFLRRGSRAK